MAYQKYTINNPPKNIRLLGDAHKNNIALYCCVCHRPYVITCMDYAFRKIGRRVTNDQEPTHEAWCCPECAEEIERIKNM